MKYIINIKSSKQSKSVNEIVEKILQKELKKIQNTEGKTYE